MPLFIARIFIFGSDCEIERHRDAAPVSRSPRGGVVRSSLRTANDTREPIRAVPQAL